MCVNRGGFWNRQFYNVEYKNKVLDVKIVSLNVFQRILRKVLGAYQSTIITQKRINSLDKQVASSQLPKFLETIELLNKVGMKILVPYRQVIKDAKTENILIIGKSHSGKSTIKEVLKDVCYVGKKEDLNPGVEEIKISGYNFKILDTSGLAQVLDQSDGRIHKIIRKIHAKVHEFFGGREFEKVDTVLITISDLNKYDVVAIKLFLSKLPPQTKKVLALTRSERHSQEHKENILSDLAKNPDFKEVYDDIKYIVFTGALEEYYIQNYSEVPFKNTLNNINSGREDLIETLLPSGLTEDERMELSDIRDAANAQRIKAFLEKNHATN